MTISRTQIVKITTTLLTTLAVVNVLWTTPVSAAGDTGVWPELPSLAEILWTFVGGALGMLVAVTGSLFDWVVAHFVIGFGHYFADEGVGFGVDTAWAYFRDLFNITFIFALVWLGFKMILRIDDSSTKRWLVNIIIAALLVNFSLFITKFIVDLSNILAIHIYDIYMDEGDDISAVFMSLLGISSVWGWKPVAAGTVEVEFGYLIGASIIFLVTAFVFASGAFMLTIRFAVLCFYMALSPLMFLGHVFPQFSSISRQYWSGFLGRAFFAPVYFLLIYLSFVVLKGMGDIKAVEAFNNQASPATVGQTAAIFLLATVFMIGSLIIANKMSANGAGAAIKIGQNMRRGAQRRLQVGAGNATAGAAARVGRNTIGRGAHSLTNSETFKRYAASGYGGRTAMNLAQGAAGASFDARQVGGAGKALGVGTGKKGGYAKVLKDEEKAHQAFVKNIGASVDTDDPAVKAKIDARAAEIQRENVAEKTKLEREAEIRIQDRGKSVATLESEINELQTAVAANQQRYNEAKTNNTMTSDELATLSTGIEKDQQLVSTKQAVLETVTKKEALQKEMVESGDGIDAAAYNQQLAAIDQEYEAATKIVKNKANSIDTRIDNLTKKAEAEMKYANEIAYMKHLEETEKFWGAMGGIIGTGLAVGGGGVTGAAAGATAGTLISSRGAYAKAGRKALEKEFGKDGMKKAAKEARKKRYQEQKEADKDLDDGDDKKDESKDTDE